HDALQYTGPGADSITLPGTVYPDWRGGVQQVDALRALARQGRPLRLIPAYGDITAYFVIERVEETRTYYKPDGTFRKQEFSVSLRLFDDGGAA
ncbi:phage tail protein, partial [Paraburkholderia sp.]|uniref:phage tail protein n=1 Tax=Paraburkholderia sp. TaxID=1926495 RepID=UPI002D5E05ED